MSALPWRRYSGPTYSMLLYLCLPWTDYIRLLAMLGLMSRISLCAAPTHLLPSFLFTHLFRLFLLHARRLGLCPFSRLVCDLLRRHLFEGQPKAHWQKSLWVTFLTSTAWSTLAPLCITYPSGGAPQQRALRSMAVDHSWHNNGHYVKVTGTNQAFLLSINIVHIKGATFLGN